MDIKNLTPKQKRWIWLGVALLALYYAPGMLMRLRYAMSARSAPYPMQSRRPQPPPPPAPRDPAALANLSGVWEGRAQLPSHGACDLRLELTQQEPGHYTGYSRFSCIPIQSMLTAPKDAGSMANFMQRTQPEGAILTGAVDKGAIRLHTDKAIGTDSDGCAVSELTITPFGASAIAAEWKEGTCPGGNLLMQRAVR